MVKLIALAVVAVVSLMPKAAGDHPNTVLPAAHGSAIAFQSCRGIAFFGGSTSSPLYYHLAALAPKATSLILQNRTTFSAKPTTLISVGWRFSENVDARPLAYISTIDEFGMLLIPIRGDYIDTASSHSGVAMLACT